jgi:hypothetical protein
MLDRFEDTVWLNALKPSARFIERERGAAIFYLLFFAVRTGIIRRG